MFTKKKPSSSGSAVMKNHSHPSRSKPLSKKDKKTTLIPVHSSQQSSQYLHSQHPESNHIPKNPYHHSSGLDQQPVFTEVWPSSDFESPPDTEAAYETELPKLSTFPVKSGVSSVLAKYVDRFRHGQPQSREERLQMSTATAENQDHFWWLSPSSLPPNAQQLFEISDKGFSHPLEDEHNPFIFNPDDHHPNRSVSPGRISFGTLSDISQSEFNDTEILDLQERASRLLPRGEDPLNDGSILISSEGLESSEFSAPVSVEEPMHRYSIPSLIKPVPVAKTISAQGNASSSWKSVIPPLVPPTRPEEDILFLWRSRRRIEQARDWSQSPSSWHTPSLGYFPASGQAHKQSMSTPALDVLQQGTHPHNTAPPPETYISGPTNVNPPPEPPAFLSGLSVSHPHSVPHVPAHMHFLSDVLPCSIQSFAAQQSMPQHMVKPQTRVIHQKSPVTEKCRETVGEVPLDGHLSSSSSSSRALEGTLTGRQTVLQRNKKKEALKKESESTAIPIKSKKMLTRVSSQQKPPNNVTPLKEQHQQRENHENLEADCSQYPKAPCSPVHSALGKVVSEVFFPTEDLPAEPQTADDRVSSRVPAPSLSPLPPSNSQNSVEVISQLLQEAEDSDEKEFQDDPLLEVLRKQRRWVKGQIKQVDSLLNDILEKDRDT